MSRVVLVAGRDLTGPLGPRPRAGGAPWGTRGTACPGLGAMPGSVGGRDEGGGRCPWLGSRAVREAGPPLHGSRARAGERLRGGRTGSLHHGAGSPRQPWAEPRPCQGAPSAGPSRCWVRASPRQSGRLAGPHLRAPLTEEAQAPGQVVFPRAPGGGSPGGHWSPPCPSRLRPFTSYKLRLKATNDIGDSDFSTETEAVTTLQDGE